MTELAIQFTAARLGVLKKLATAGDWMRDDDFYSAIPERMGALRGTRFGRKMRSLPYRATFLPMIAAGLVEEHNEPGWRRTFRITEAGRAALKRAVGEKDPSR